MENTLIVGDFPIQLSISYELPIATFVFPEGTPILGTSYLCRYLPLEMSSVFSLTGR